jgi:hypothetical protein
MLKHFIKRDFIDLQLYWVCVCGIIVVLSIASMFLGPREVKIIPAAITYFLFLISTFPLSHVLGTNWRNKHYLSRQYLLALPVSRRRLFFIQQIRIGVFNIPFYIFAIFTPLFFIKYEILRVSFVSIFCIYLLFLTASVLLYIHSLIAMTLAMEKMTSHISQSESFKKMLYGFLLGGLFIALILLAWSPFHRLIMKTVLADTLNVTFSLMFQFAGGFLLLLIMLVPLIWYNQKNWSKS